MPDQPVQEERWTLYQQPNATPLIVAAGEREIAKAHGYPAPISKVSESARGGCAHCGQSPDRAFNRCPYCRPESAPLEQGQLHELKCWPPYFEDIRAGRKNFECRVGDRYFESGDALHLREFDPEKGYTGRELTRTVTYVLHGGAGGQFGIKSGHVVMALAQPETPQLHEDRGEAHAERERLIRLAKTYEDLLNLDEFGSPVELLEALCERAEQNLPEPVADCRGGDGA